MHMADALLSPSVGGTMWAVSLGVTVHCSAKLRSDGDDQRIPMMGVLGAFLFAAQMINFSIPATGSSGHLGGGILLSVLLGPQAAFLTISSVLVVQALFFADGGLLALGCNIFNMGFIPACLVHGLLYRRIVGKNPSHRRISAAIMISSIIALQLGAFCVVLETVLSGVSLLPFSKFALFMQPIHLAIGIVEGLATVAVVSFIQKVRPDIINNSVAVAASTLDSRPLKRLVIGFLTAAFITGGVVAWFASEDPDGLEWAISRTAREEIMVAQNDISRELASLQDKLSFLPDYGFRQPLTDGNGQEVSTRIGTSISGILGSIMTLIVISMTGLFLKMQKR